MSAPTRTGNRAGPSAPSGRTAATTAMLLGGAAAGPLFIVVAFAQVFLRDGFDPARHPLSLLSLGDAGWVQISNFVLAGLLFIAAAIGMRRVMRPGRGAGWGPALVGVFGACLVAGGLLLADPAYGFPPGTPPGAPEELTWHGVLHGIAPAAGFLALVMACLVLASWFARRRARGWAVYSVVTGVTILPLSVWPNLTGDPSGRFLPLWAAMVLGFVWASLVAARLAATRPTMAAATAPAAGGSTGAGPDRADRV